MTKGEANRIIRKTQDRSLNKLKRMIKNNIQKEERKSFTFNDFMQLITEINQEREKEIQKVSFRRTKNTIKIEREER